MTPKEFRAVYLSMLPDKRIRNMQLNSTESAMDQLSKMTMQLVSDYYWDRVEKLLAIYKDPEVVYDIYMTHYQMALSHFLRHKVGLHKYNRKFTFYQNVWSSVISVHYDVESIYTRRLRENQLSDSIYDNVDELEGVRLVDTLGHSDRILPQTYNPVKKTLDELIEEDRAILGLD